MTLYGIKNCDSVKRAVKFLKSRNIDFGCETVDRWLRQIPVEALFNSRSVTYRKLGLKSADLDEKGRREWLCRENMLIKRPVIECDDGKIIVGFDEELYKEIFNEQHNP